MNLGSEGTERRRSTGLDAAKLAYRLGAAVRCLREDEGWSQSELARKAEMPQSAVARFEAGGGVPTLPVLKRLEQALNVHLEVQFRVD